jgi:hypothetical protein
MKVLAIYYDYYLFQKHNQFQQNREQNNQQDNGHSIQSSPFLIEKNQNETSNSVNLITSEPISSHRLPIISNLIVNKHKKRECSNGNRINGISRLTNAFHLFK